MTICLPFAFSVFMFHLNQSFPNCCHIRICLRMVPVWDSVNSIDFDAIAEGNFFLL